MPTYQYRCTECGNELEAVQRFTDPALTECPACAGQLRKVYNAVGVVFKGSGFYRTDSRADGNKANGSGSSGDSTSGGASTSTEKKSDSSTPAEKSGGKQPVTAGSGTVSTGSSSGSSTAA